MYQVECDTHTHTLYSRHAFSTLEENVKAARKAGLTLLASTDHFSSMLYPDYQELKHYQYLLGTNMWPRKWHGITILKGVEADIIDMEGRMFGHDIYYNETTVGDAYETEQNLQKMVFDRMDFVIASVHGKSFTLGQSIAATTDMYIKALEHPKVFFMGHMGRAGVPFDLDAVLGRARELHKPIEINEHSFDWKGEHIDTCRMIAEKCAELGVSVCVNTDSHIAFDIGRMDNALNMLKSIHFPKELIINRTKESFIQGLKDSGVVSLDL